MGKLRVSVLGPISASLDGRDLALAGRQPRAVLAILALAGGRAVTVDQLLDDLWPDGVSAGATNTLQSYVSTIRRVAGDPGVVQRRGPAYALAVEPDDVDALRFEALVAESRTMTGDPHGVVQVLDDALALWRGRPLADVDGEPFAIGPIARLDELHAEALERRFDAELALGRHAEIIGRLEETAAEHPLREHVAAQLALAQYRAGRQADALRSIERIRTRLVEELGLSPGDELLALERSILVQDPALAAPERPAAPAASELPRAAATSLVHPMHGRASELSVVLGHWADAREHRGSVVVVGGEAGVGKTRLLAELAAAVHRDGRPVVWGRCTEASRLPYEPFVEAVTAVRSRGRRGGGFSDLLSASAGADPTLGVLALHEAVTEQLTTTLDAGGLLVIDDLHWADRTTTAMLAHVAGAVASLPVLVAIGRRAGARNPDVDRALGELRRRTEVHRVDLSGLAPEAVRHLVTEVRGADDGLADRLHERTSGNPFFIRELLAADDDSLPPATIAEVVAARIGPPDQPVGRLLAAAAVLDRDADIDLLAEIARLEEDDALAALDQALAGDLLRERATGDDEVSFSHAIVRETAYRSLTGARRRRLHRQAAAAIGTRHDVTERGRHQVEIARHLLAAGTAANAAEVARAAEAAASWCLHVLAYDDAVAIARAALAVVDEHVRDDVDAVRVNARLRLHLARALNRTGDPDTARDELRGVLTTAHTIGDSPLVADAALAMGGGPGAGAGVRWGVVDTELVDALEAALAAEPPVDAARRARLLAALAQALYNDPSAAARSDRAAAEAVAIGEELDDPEILGTALVARCIALWRPAGLHERLALARRAVELGARTAYDAMAITAHIRLLPDAFEAADLDLVRWSLDALDETTARLRQPRFRWYVPLARSALALTLGDVAQAQAEADVALEIAGTTQADGPALSHLVGTAMIERDRGRMRVVEPMLRDRMRQDPANTTPRLLLALLLAEGGREAEALEVVGGDLSEALAPIPFDYLWLGHLALLAEVVARCGTAAHARTLHDALGVGAGRLLMLGATAPVGAGDRALGLLRATCGDDLAATEALLRGRDIHRRIGARYLEARAEADLAHVHRAGGREQDADDAHARAVALAGELGLPVPTSPLAARLATS